MTTMPATIYPTMSYRDAAKMIDWLERAFGFQKHAAFTGNDGTVTHAELRFGDGLVMFGSIKDDTVFGKLVRPPNELGAASGAIYIAVPEVDGLCERAKAAGAKIVMEPTDQPYGSRDFICTDPEGHVWCFGTYTPGT
jgi:uncharacterized glyoxalase superfamily protein PhnB